jgi:hypothetical protein
MRNLILAYERGHHRINVMKKALESLGQPVVVATDNFDDIKGPFDRIWTLSESLLPVQAQLEIKWGINNLSVSAAETLTDKKKFDDFCTNIGLGELVPKSVIPTKEEDLFDGNIIVKPTVGSGAKLDGFSYTSYYNTSEMLDNAPQDFFNINKTGFKNPKFNNVLGYYMVQELLPEYSEVYAPYYWINGDGEFKRLFTVKLTMKRTNYGNTKFMVHPIWIESVSFDEIPTKVSQHFDIFVEHIADVLGVKNMFLSGPDYYFYDNTVKFIDCNPRIGQGLQIMDKIHDYKLLPSIISGNMIEIEKHFVWGNTELKPGKIKNIADHSHLKKHFSETSHELFSGKIILDQSNVADSYFQHCLVVSGKEKPDTLEAYRAIRKELQDCIEYD